MVIASGRAFALLSNVLPQLPNVEYALTSNGAAITHVPTGRQILRETIPATKSQALIRVLEECGAIFEVYCEGNSFVEKSVYDRFTSPHLSREFIAELRSHITPVDSLSKALFGKEIEKINALLIPEDSRTCLLYTSRCV